MTKKLTYKKAVEEIESILLDIENEETDIDKLPERIKRVSELITFCKTKLRSIEDELNNDINNLA